MTPTPTPAPTPATRLTARSPEDLLAAAAVVLGFWPSESVVMLTFDAAHPFHARVDLPDEPAALPELASCLVRPAVQHDVGRVVLLLYSADTARAEAAWRGLARALDDHGVAVVEALHVGPRSWRALPHGAVVPLDLDALAAHPFLAEAVLAGRVLHGSRTDLAATLDADPAAVAAVEAALDHVCVDRPGGSLHDDADLLATGTWVHDLVSDHLTREATAPAPGDGDVARLLVALQSLRVRDAAWSAITRPRARAATAFFADVLRRAPDHLVAPPAALLAWAAWQAGDGALAWCALDRCEAADPAYGLAALIGEALERAVPPSVMADGFDWKDGLHATATDER